MTAPWVVGEVVSAGTPLTHALVVGVSHYRNLPAVAGDPPPTDNETFGLGQASTPATSAMIFARWLRDAYRNPAAPLGTVRLLLSPSELERAALPELASSEPAIAPADRASLEAAVDAWYEECNTSPDNVAILYASGHGIQTNKDDGGIVLLEDFASVRRVLDHSLDIGAVRAGMAGPTMAQRQFFFVDACRTRPEALADFQSMGRGIGLPNPFEGAPHCSAVFFSASPSTEALGEPGRGTLFSQALVDCFSLLAVDGHVDEEGRWVVMTSRLMEALDRRVRELAAAHGVEQVATVGGQVAPVPFHYLPAPPAVPLTITVAPEEATSCAWARLWHGETDEVIFDRTGFPSPTLATTVPAGLYLLAVTIDPATEPFRDRPTLPVAALPPAATRPVKLV